MVEERITDGRRIAQLFASELDGRSDGTLDDVAVTNADPDVEPHPDGAHAYDVTVEGAPVASVLVSSDSARLVLSTSTEAVLEETGFRGLRTVQEPNRGEALIAVEHAAAVKRAVDALMAAVGETD